MFLVGKGIPDRITSLPQTVLNTPFGQMLKPQLDQALRGVTQAPVAPPPTRTNGVTGSASKLPKAVTNGVPHTQGHVQDVSKLSVLLDLLEKANSSCATIFFTSSTCAPCKICYPVYDELAAEFEGKATLIKVDIDFAHEIAMQYQVRATPTFVTLLHGSKLDEWTGADPAKLRGNVRLLVQMAHPPHPHLQLRLPTLQRKQKPITYAKMPPLDKLLAKLSPEQSSDPSIQSLKSFIEARTASSTAASAPVPDLNSLSAFIRSTSSPSPSHPPFPLTDLLRLSLLDPRVSGFFAEEPPSHSLILHLLTHSSALSSSDPFSPSTPSTYPFLLTTTQALANLFTSPLARRTLLENPDFRALLLDLISNTLAAAADQSTSQHTALRAAAASLAFNICASVHNARFDVPAPEREALDEGAQVELLAALLEALSREVERRGEGEGREDEGSKEGTKVLLLAVGLLAYQCPREGEVRDLLRAMGTREVVGRLGGDVAEEVGRVVE